MTNNPSWQEAALHDLEFTNLSYREIGQKYGRDRDTIIKLKKRYNLTRKVPTRSGSRRITEREPLSAVHRAIGIRLNIFRGDRTYDEVAQQIGVSGLALRYMEIGVHDLTVTHLIRISEVLKVSLGELTTPFTVASSPQTIRKNV